MTPPAAVVMEFPRLFALEDGAYAAGPSLDDVVLQILADADHGSCLVCEGTTRPIVGGVRCQDCGAELVMGAEPAPLWAA
jgi:hypothetical protein